jgi:hypothetical protein
MYVLSDKASLHVGKDVDEMNGIFVLAGEAVMTADLIRNSDTSSAWESAGGLTINGVIVGTNIEDLINARRSVLRGWFHSSSVTSRQKMFEEGASLLIQNNPQLWISPPPGVDELDKIFEVYKK